MIHSLERLDVRRGREIFVFISAFAITASVALLLSRDWQALLYAMIAITCIQPIRERPVTAGPWLTTLIALMGIVLWFAIQVGISALIQWLA